jgi:hypothetical protein
MKQVMVISMFAVAVSCALIATVPVAAVSMDDMSLKFLPAETQGIAFIDVAALRGTPLVQEAMQNRNMSMPRSLSELTAGTGFDPRRDLDKVTIAKFGGRESLVILQGSIDKSRVEQFFNDNGKEHEAYMGHNLYHDGNNGFVVLDNVVVSGPVNMVKNAVDQMQMPGSPALRGDLMAAIQTIAEGNQVWAVGNFTMTDLGAMGVRGPAPALEMMKSLQAGTYQMRVDTGIHAIATGSFADGESAKNAGDLALGALAVAKVQAAKQQPDMVNMLDGIQVVSIGKTVTVTIEESGDVLKKLSELRAIGKTLQ